MDASGRVKCGDGSCKDKKTDTVDAVGVEVVSAVLRLLHGEQQGGMWHRGHLKTRIWSDNGGQSTDRTRARDHVHCSPRLAFASGKIGIFSIR